MEEKNSRNLRYVEEFELVNPNNGGVYTEKGVYIGDPVISKDGKTFECKIYDSQNNTIGVAKVSNGNKSITLDPRYIDRKRIEIDGKEFDFDAEELEADVNKMLELQLQKEQELERGVIQRKPEENTINKNKLHQEESEKSSEENQQENTSTPIEQEELVEQGYNISAYSKITDQRVIDAMIVSTIDPKSVIVAEVDGQYKFLGKEIGTGEIVELEERVGGNQQAEEVNKFEGNVENKTGRGTTMIMPDYGNMEFNIEKNNCGQIEVGYIEDIDGDGTREVIPVETDAVHPTMEEYQRAQMEKYEKYGNYEFIRDDAILTGQEIEDRLADEEQSVRDEVNADLEQQAENPTKSQLEETIEQTRDEQAEKEDDEGKETEEEEWEFGRPRPRPRY